MTVSINGSGGITYPDGSVNTTRSASTAGDTFTGLVNVNTTGFGLKTSGAGFSGISMRATGTGGREYVLSSTDNANGLGGGLLNIYDQTASAPRLSIDSTGAIRTFQAPQNGKFNIYTADVAPLVVQNAGASWAMHQKVITTYAANQTANLATHVGGGNQVVAYKVTAKVTSAVSDAFSEYVGWAFVRYVAASGTVANYGITQQMTAVYQYNMGVPGNISWSQNGVNWTLRYTNTTTAYWTHVISVEAFCRDGASLTFDTSYVNLG